MHFSQASEARGSPEDPAAGGHVRVREHVSAGAGVDMWRRSSRLPPLRTVFLE